MEQDRNLLFGVLAVQLGKVTSGRLMQVAAAWVVDPSESLDSRLVRDGALKEADREMIERFVDEAIRAHAGDAHATLNTFGGAERVLQTFGGTVPVASDDTDSPTVAFTPVPPPDTGIPEVPGRYHLVSEQGKGGYGRVLLVHDQYMSRDIALKELIPPTEERIGSNAPTPSREEAEAVARFLQEARITGQLEHPSIVPIYELGHRSDGSLYYTMKLVRGKTLTKEMAQRTTTRDRLELLARYLDLCNAIAYAHDRGVIHRDIKPDNVMIGSFGETVVIDWGLAKLRGRADVHAEELKATVQLLKAEPTSSAKTLYGTILGTPHYMAPEQARGDIENVDERSDVYALGAVLYMLLTGKRPYHDAPLQNVILHMNLPPLTPVAKLASDAPPELIAICSKALRMKQSERYQNAGELAREVERFMSGALVQAHQYTLRDQWRRFVQKYRAQVATAGLAAAVLLIVAVASYVQILQANSRERAQRIAAETAEKRAVENERRQTEARAAAEYELYISNVRLAYQSIGENQFDIARKLLEETPPMHRNFEWGMLQYACNQDLATLNDAGEPILAVCASSDGAMIAAGDASGAVTVWDAHTNAVLRRADMGDDPILCLAFSPQREFLAVGLKSPKISVYDAQTLEKKFELTGHTSAVNAVAYSPDGKLLASASSDDTVRIWDIEKREAVHVLLHHLNDAIAVAWAADQSFLVTAGLDNRAVIWDTATWTPRRELVGHTNDVTCAAISPDGKRIATGGEDGRVIVWDALDGHVISDRPMNADVRSIAFSKDSVRLAASVEGPVVHLFDAATTEGAVTLRGHSGEVTSLAFVPPNDILVTGSRDRTAKLWHAPVQLAGPEPASSGMVGHEVHVADMGMRVFAAASTHGTCSIFDLRQGEVTRTIDGLGTTGLGGRLWQFDPAAARLLFTGDDHKPTVLDLASGTRTQLQFKSAPFYPAISNSGSTIALSSTSGDIDLFNASTGELIQSVHVLDAGNHMLPLFSADDTKLAVVIMDKQPATVMLVDLKSGQPAWTATYPSSAADLQFDTDSKALYVSGRSGLHIYAVDSGKELPSPFPQLPIAAFAIAPDARRLIGETLGSSLIVFDLSTGRELLRFDRAIPYAPADSLSNGRIAFSESGNALHVWSTDCQGLDTFSQISTFPWSEMQLTVPEGQTLGDSIERHKRERRAQREDELHRRDRANGWFYTATMEGRQRDGVNVAANRDSDPFSSATVKEFDVPSDKWAALLQMGRARLKNLRDTHGYRGMDIASDLVLDTSLAEFLSMLGFENNDIIVRINDSTTPGYDMFIEALESAERKGSGEITVAFYRAGQAMIFRYFKKEPAAETSPTAGSQ